MPKKVMDSMNYEYDYFSIMHYGTKFFSKNGKATIKIRKRGRRIGAEIGQRKGLSWIDVAQVHAMYNCNKIPSEESSKLKELGAKGSLRGNVYCVIYEGMENILLVGRG